MTYTVKDFYNAVNKLAPFSLAMKWDNAGILLGSPDMPVKKALTALDATCAVIEEAAAFGAQLIVTHHPVIFEPVKAIAADCPVWLAVRAGLAVISAHTCLDIAKGGVNDALASVLGLRDIKPLSTQEVGGFFKIAVYVPREASESVYEAMTGAGAGRQGSYAGAAFFSEGTGRFIPLEGAKPAIGRVGETERIAEIKIEALASHADLPGILAAIREAHPYEEPAVDVIPVKSGLSEAGTGRVGELENPLSPNELAKHVKTCLASGGVKYIPGRDNISRVAVCGGSGADYLPQAVSAGAQALVTADCKHHQLLEAKDRNITLIDAGHYSTEAVILPGFTKALREMLPKAEIIRAKSCADPARYL